MSYDLISRERALKALRDTKTTVKGIRAGSDILVEYASQVREGYIDAIRKVPTVRIGTVSESHGQWIYMGKSKSGYPIWKCSHCGKERTGKQAISAYCRDCGCHMDLNDVIPGQISIDI